MALTKFTREFSLVFELSTRLRSEMYAVNTSLVETDPDLVLRFYKKARSTFKELKIAVDELDRSISTIEFSDEESAPVVDS